jgi:hypothetical protein
VIDMTRCNSVAPLGSQFDSFLFAPIGEERNGMLLSVVSALARLNLDPWEEATVLARLPDERARQRLASLIAALPDGSSAPRDPDTIAARLIALLPNQARSNGSAPNGRPETRVGSKSPTSTYVVVYVILMAIILGGQMMVAGPQPMPAPVDGSQLPTSSTEIPQAPLR